MSLTPGELLAKYLETHEIEKTELAKRLGTQYLTVHRWTKDDGFNKKNRHRAAAELGLPLDYFDKPELDGAARIREEERRAAFAKFAASEKGQRLSRTMPEVMRALSHAPVPPGWRVLTTDFFEGLALVYTGQLSREQFADSVEMNTRVRESAEQKTAAASKIANVPQNDQVSTPKRTK